MLVTYVSQRFLTTFVAKRSQNCVVGQVALELCTHLYYTPNVSPGTIFTVTNQVLKQMGKFSTIKWGAMEMERLLIRVGDRGWTGVSHPKT